MCRVERWRVRTLRKKIDGMLYERTAISKKPEELVKKELSALRDEDRITPDLVFRDPYFLDFLGLMLCAGKTSQQIELLQLDKSGIKVAEYMTELPKRKLLEQKLHKAVEMARKQLEASPTNGNTGDR